MSNVAFMQTTNGSDEEMTFESLGLELVGDSPDRVNPVRSPSMSTFAHAHDVTRRQASAMTSDGTLDIRDAPIVM